MESGPLYLLLVILFAVLGVTIQYQIIKGAVRNGVVEAHAIMDKRQEPAPEETSSGGRHGAHAVKV